LRSAGCTHVAMESTSSYWRPVYNLLEGLFEVLVGNAYHMKAVPGRKTDVKDAEWIVELLAHGLLRPSFVPPMPQRVLRDLTRQRTHLIRERASSVNRLQKVLEWANIKLSSVVSDITGVSARAMLLAMVDGQTEPRVLAELAKGRMRTKLAELEQALQGRFEPHQAFMVSQHLALIEAFDEQIAAFEERICRAIESTREDPPSSDRQADESAGSDKPTQVAKEAPEKAWSAQALLDAIPGIGITLAQTVLAELGTDMQRFRDAGHASSWAGLAPGQNESAGKRKSTRIRDGNKYLRNALLQAAWAASKKKESVLAAFYQRLAARRGKKKAIIALAHKILRIIYSILKTGELYQERGAAAMDERQKERIIHRLERRITELGYSVQLQPRTAAET